MIDRALCPHIAPFIRDMKPGEYAWCRCGSTANEPFCDGSHKGTPLSPLRVVIEKAGKVSWCGCKRTSTPPYCDSTHEKLG